MKKCNVWLSNYGECEDDAGENAEDRGDVEGSAPSPGTIDDVRAEGAIPVFGGVADFGFEEILPDETDEQVDDADEKKDVLRFPLFHRRNEIVDDIRDDGDEGGQQKQGSSDDVVYPTRKSLFHNSPK